ncbi:hypothetical protein R3X45_25165, partial [Salmonella enterica subsp. enterica serovar Typhimurium]|nr:hypothetical protein [Salmonella enterica subsp. enterica serovar Typhimurium]
MVYKVEGKRDGYRKSRYLEQLINDKLNSAAISDYAPKWFTRSKEKETGTEKVVT